MAFNISYLYQIIDKASRPLVKISGAQKKVAKFADVAATKAKRFSKALNNLRKRAGSAAAKMRSLGGSLTLRVTAPLGVLAGLALRSSANLETLQTSFESMLGSAKKARELTKQLVEFTARTPFQLEGVGKAAKQLLAFGVTTEELLPTMLFLGDIAAGSGGSISEMAAIFGKVKAKGRAFTEELLQLSDRGIPIIDVLAKRFGVTKEAIFDAASKGKISFEILEDAMKKMTAKGGIFFAQMDRQSETLAGLFSTLKDNISLALAELGDSLSKSLDLKQLMKDLISGIQTATKAFAEFAKNNPALVKVGLIITGIAVVVGPLIASLGFLLVGFSLLSVPVLIAVAAIAALVAGGVALIVFWDDLVRSIKKVVDWFMNGIRVMGLILAAMDKFTTAGFGKVFSAISENIMKVVVMKDDILAFFAEISDVAIAAATPVIQIWDDIAGSISGALSTVSGGIETAKSFFGFGGDSEVRAPQPQELSGNLGIDINLSGNTGAVQSASARPKGNGNLGMNMAFAQ